jgi:O-antigen ligase
VDNQYLLVAATQGLTGLGLFLLILAGSGVRLFRLAAMPLPGEDRTLVLAHLTVLMGLVVSLTTVYLGEQALILLFFVIGWIHGMRPAETGAAAELDTGLEMGKTSGPEFRFQKVLI